MTLPDPSEKSVIILSGPHMGQEGICLGKVGNEEGVFAVSPENSNAIVNLRFPDEFGILLNKGQEPGRN